MCVALAVAERGNQRHAITSLGPQGDETNYYRAPQTTHAESGDEEDNRCKAAGGQSCSGRGGRKGSRKSVMGQALLLVFLRLHLDMPIQHVAHLPLWDASYDCCELLHGHCVRDAQTSFSIDTLARQGQSSQERATLICCSLW